MTEQRISDPTETGPAAAPAPARGGRKRRVAIVLFNLGGPDKPESIRPFLLNLFSDRAILRVPGLVRFFLARLITRRRVPEASAIYAELGGRSPLLELTEQQARALEGALAAEPDMEARAFIAMRYWHPMSEAAARAVKAWNPDEILLLPLYPQFSTTTTGSSLDAWRIAASRVGLMAETRILCCYHSDEGFVASMAAKLRQTWQEARASLPPGTPLRALFSAHGLPEDIVKAGDPYQWQVEQTVEAVRLAAGLSRAEAVVCYQSRVTPQVWIGPSTEDEIARAGNDKAALVVVPIAFVSDHSETLVELDIEYREEAEKLGLPGYWRVPALNGDAAFIAALADLVRHARGQGERRLCSFAGGRQCPKAFGDCPHAGRARAERPAAAEAAAEAAA